MCTDPFHLQKFKFSAKLDIDSKFNATDFICRVSGDRYHQSFWCMIFPFLPSISHKGLWNSAAFSVINSQSHWSPTYIGVAVTNDR